MTAKYVTLFAMTIILFGCGTLPLPNDLTDTELRNVVIAEFGTDQYLQIHQVLYSPTSFALGSKSEALALASKMKQSEQGRLDLVVVCSSSKGSAKEIRNALKYRRGDWSNLNLLFVGSQSDALALKPDVENAGINFAYYDKK